MGETCTNFWKLVAELHTLWWTFVLYSNGYVEGNYRVETNGGSSFVDKDQLASTYNTP